MSATTTVTVRIPSRLKKRLNKLADATSRSRSSLAADALKVYVEEEERHLSAIREGVRDLHDGRV
ncbi:MAG: CopG family ribbon-helix-helix protein, partial [Candidatus Acidiferrales bacterium]